MYVPTCTAVPPGASVAFTSPAPSNLQTPPSANWFPAAIPPRSFPISVSLYVLGVVVAVAPVVPVPEVVATTAPASLATYP